MRVPALLPVAARWRIPDTALSLTADPSYENMMTKELAVTKTSTALDSDVYDVVRQEAPVKAHTVYDKLSALSSVQPHEVARSIWRLVDHGRVIVHAGKGILLAKE